MSGLDLTNLAPGDAVAALRSYPRRYRQALLPLPDDLEARQRAEQIGADGSSALDHTLAAARAITLLDAAVTQVLREDRPALHPGVVDPTQRVVAEDRPLDPDAALDLLDEACTSLADRADGASSDDWYRPATVAGDGRALEAYDLLLEAVRVGADHLRQVDQLVAEQD